MKSIQCELPGSAGPGPGPKNTCLRNDPHIDACLSRQKIFEKPEGASPWMGKSKTINKNFERLGDPEKFSSCSNPIMGVLVL